MRSATIARSFEFIKGLLVFGMLLTLPLTWTFVSDALWGDHRPHNPDFLPAFRDALAYCEQQEWPLQQHRCVQLEAWYNDNCREGCLQDDMDEAAFKFGFDLPPSRIGEKL